MIALISGLFAGFLTSLSFQPAAIWPLSIIGLGIWYQILCREQIKRRSQTSYLFGLGLLLPTQMWTGIYVGNLPWLILCFTQAVFFLLPALFVGKKKRYNSIAFILSYLIIELLLRTLPFTGFGWSRIGFTQVDSPIKSIYPILGVVGVTLILAWLATVRTIKTLLFPVLVVVIAYVVPSPVYLDRSIKIALIQGGVVNLGLNFNDKPKEVFLRHLEQTRKSLVANQVNLIVWPENSVDVDILKNQEIRQAITDLSQELQTPILVGGVTNSPNLRNQSMLFNPVLSQVYTKRYLTPFGEYLPIRTLAERISPYAKQIEDFSAGTDAVLFTTDNTEFRSLICYELLDDRLVSERSNNFVVIQTNNATFGDSAQLDQQLNIAQARAAESSRFITYVSTTGVTSFIDNKGQIKSQIAKFKPGTLIDDVKIASGTSYAHSYSWLLEPGAIVVLLLIVIYRRRGRT